jgi:uncharacterized membrane protein YccC
VWSADAAIRALRATIVVPSVFALTLEVIGNGQLALFSVFGSFATLVMASFGGTRRDKVVAHLGLALVGSIAVIIGTAVSGTAWLAAIVTVPVAFAIFFAGVAGPNAGSGTTAALLAYVLPVASPGPFSTIPARLGGWWLASAVSAAAVLLLTRRSAGDRLRAAASDLAAALAAHLTAAVSGRAAPADRDASVAAKHQLMSLFAATPYRPTGLATADQALSSVVQLLEWCASLICDALGGHLDLSQAAPADTRLLGDSARVLAGIAGLLAGRPGNDPRPDLARLEQSRAGSVAHQQQLAGDPDSCRACAAHAVHAQTIAVTVRGAAADALIAARRAGPHTIAAERRRWYGEQDRHSARRGRAVAVVVGLAAPHASLRSVWFRSSTRGAVALAIAVAVADLSGVQHGFWVVLGTLSVLRTNAASTGATALRALLGTTAGFAAGAALLLAIGTSPAALWVVLPLAVLVASYAPGTAPFAVGQAAFTVTVVVLFNLLVPAGWTVGLLRVEDVGIGCAVSLVIGALFWPHGASAVVGDDLADAFRRGGTYLTQAVDWALSGRATAPGTAVATLSAGIRLEDALRGYLAEQGAKRMTKDDLWDLVMATTRLRLTAYSLAGLSGPAQQPAGQDDRDRGAAALRDLAAQLAGFYERVAAQVGPPGRAELAAVTVPALDGLAGHGSAAASGLPPAADGAPGAGGPAGRFDPRTTWVHDHLQHLASHAPAITAPALHLAEQRRLPWWR